MMKTDLKQPKTASTTARYGASPCTERVQQAKERVLNAVPRVDLERATIMTESFMQTGGEALAVRKAEVFREQCQRKTIFIQERELIVGTPGSSIRAGMLSPDVAWHYLDEELDTISARAQDPFLITEEQKKLFKEFIKPYWQGKSVYDAWLARIPEDIRQLSVDSSILDLGVVTESGPGQVTAGFDWLLSSGVEGIRSRIEEKLASLDDAVAEHHDKITYLNALLIVCDGITVLAERYARLAEEKAGDEKDGKRQAELEEIAEVCRRVPAHPARNFREALQALWFYQVCLQMEYNANAISPGRLDQYLYPYYKKDIDDGLLTREQAQELLECLWVKFAEITPFRSKWVALYDAGYMPFHNTSCGGISGGGQDAVNELSYMMLQATMDVQLSQPSLSVKYNKGKNPDSFLRKIVELVKLGTGFPAIHNDEAGIKMLLNKGVTLAEANNWNPAGCVEPGLMGKLLQWSNLAELNLGTAFEFALTNGRQQLTNTWFPVPETGDPRRFKSFAQFREAVKTQVAYLIRKEAEISQIIESISQELRPTLVASVTFKDCIDNAKDHQCGGAKYSLGPAMIMVGVADIINSLAAVKKLIYDDKKMTWDELLTALDNDFEGYQEIRQMCLAAPKYGNDIGEVDEIATEIFQFEAEEVEKYRGYTGGKMVSGLYPVTAHVPMGEVVGALPSGRKARTPLADGLSPMQGTDVNGPTAVLKSVSSIDHAMHSAGTLLNMKLEPSLLDDERGIGDVMSLIKSMCDLGIYHIQFNVVSEETLRAAQREPEKYRDLMVRVAGYSAYFVNLAKSVQDDIIARTEQKSLA